MNVRRLKYLVGIALLTFLVGISAYRFKATLHTASINEQQMIPVAQLSEDEWHRLYEAAMMSGDSDVRAEMMEKLMCMGPEYALDGRLIVVKDDAYCMKADRSVDLQSYGRLPKSSYQTLLRGHHSWVMRHISFLAEVNTQDKAKEFVRAHRR